MWATTVSLDYISSVAYAGESGLAGEAYIGEFLWEQILFEQMYLEKIFKFLETSTIIENSEKGHTSSLPPPSTMVRCYNLVQTIPPQNVYYYGPRQ